MTYTNDKLHWSEFKKFKNLVNSEIKKASYFQQAFNTNAGDSRKTWQIVNELTARNSNKISNNQVDFKEKSVHGPAEIAEAFDEHFSTVAEDICTNLQRSTVNFEDFLTKIDIKNPFYLQEVNHNDI